MSREDIAGNEPVLRVDPTLERPACLTGSIGASIDMGDPTSSSSDEPRNNAVSINTVQLSIMQPSDGTVIPSNISERGSSSSGDHISVSKHIRNMSMILPSEGADVLTDTSQLSDEMSRELSGVWKDDSASWALASAPSSKSSVIHRPIFSALVSLADFVNFLGSLLLFPPAASVSAPASTFSSTFSSAL